MAGRVVCKDRNNNNTVEYWSRQVAQSLAEAATTRKSFVAPGGVASVAGGVVCAAGGVACDAGGVAKDTTAQTLVKEHFPEVLVNLLRRHRCFTSLKFVVPIFDTMFAAGATQPKGFLVLKALTVYNLDSLLDIDLTGVDVETRRRYLV